VKMNVPMYRRRRTRGSSLLTPKPKPKRNPPRQTEPVYRRQHLRVYQDDLEYSESLRHGVMVYHVGSLGYETDEQSSVSPISRSGTAETSSYDLPAAA